MMKFSLILFSGCIAVGLAAKTFEIAPESQLCIDLTAASYPQLLRIRSRIKLPAGQEGWGAYFLRLKLNDQELKTPLLNTGKLWNISKLPSTSSEQYSAKKRAWFVKADSNFIAFDCAVPGNEFRRSTYLQKRNLRDDRSGYTNSYYDKVFKIPAGKNKLTLHNLSPRHQLVIEVQTAPMRSDLLFFVPRAGKNIYPWSFPECHEIEQPIKLRLCPGERDCATLALRNLTAQKFVASFKLMHFSLNRRSSPTTFVCDIRIQANRLDPGNEGFKYVELAGQTIQLPDRLIATDKFEVPPQSSGVLWLLLSVPTHTTPGVYHSELVLNNKYHIPIEIEVLPFKLAKIPRLYGLWSNRLPGNDPVSRQRQINDMRSHGINSFILDAWTVPVRRRSDGSWDTARFDWVLAWLKQIKMNHPVLLYGLLGPLLQDIGKQAGNSNYASTEFQREALKVFKKLTSHAEKQGFKIYFHLEDEPDIHPQKFNNFVILSRTLKKEGIKLCSNLTPAGLYHCPDLIDINLSAAYNGLIAGWCNKSYSNLFYPKWLPAPAKFIQKNCHYSYVQVRSTAPLAARTEFGFYCDAMHLQGMWGFAYFWGINHWNIAYPILEKDGRLGTTVGWEMLHAGIQDSRYLHTLKEIAQRKNINPIFKLPDIATLQSTSMEEIAKLRDDIINEILTIKSH